MKDALLVNVQQQFFQQKDTKHDEQHFHRLNQKTLSQRSEKKKIEETGTVSMSSFPQQNYPMQILPSSQPQKEFEEDLDGLSHPRDMNRAREILEDLREQKKMLSMLLSSQEDSIASSCSSASNTTNHNRITETASTRAPWSSQSSMSSFVALLVTTPPNANVDANASPASEKAVADTADTADTADNADAADTADTADKKQRQRQKIRTMTPDEVIASLNENRERMTHLLQRLKQMRSSSSFSTEESLSSPMSLSSLSTSEFQLTDIYSQDPDNSNDDDGDVNTTFSIKDGSYGSDYHDHPNQCRQSLPAKQHHEHDQQQDKEQHGSQKQQQQKILVQSQPIQQKQQQLEQHHKLKRIKPKNDDKLQHRQQDKLQLQEKENQQEQQKIQMQQQQNQQSKAPFQQKQQTQQFDKIQLPERQCQQQDGQQQRKIGNTHPQHQQNQQRAKVQTTNAITKTNRHHHRCNSDRMNSRHVHYRHKVDQAIMNARRKSKRSRQQKQHNQHNGRQPREKDHSHQLQHQYRKKEIYYATRSSSFKNGKDYCDSQPEEQRLNRICHEPQQKSGNEQQKQPQIKQKKQKEKVRTTIGRIQQENNNQIQQEILSSITTNLKNNETIRTNVDIYSKSTRWESVGECTHRRTGQSQQQQQQMQREQFEKENNCCCQGRDHDHPTRGQQECNRKNSVSVRRFTGVSPPSSSTSLSSISNTIHSDTNTNVSSVCTLDTDINSDLDAVYDSIRKENVKLKVKQNGDMTFHGHGDVVDVEESSKYTNNTTNITATTANITVSNHMNSYDDVQKRQHQGVDNGDDKDSVSSITSYSSAFSFFSSSEASLSTSLSSCYHEQEQNDFSDNNSLSEEMYASDSSGSTWFSNSYNGRKYNRDNECEHHHDDHEDNDEKKFPLPGREGQQQQQEQEQKQEQHHQQQEEWNVSTVISTINTQEKLKSYVVDSISFYGSPPFFVTNKHCLEVIPEFDELRMPMNELHDINKAGVKAETLPATTFLESNQSNTQIFLGNTGTISHCRDDQYCEDGKEQDTKDGSYINKIIFVHNDNDTGRKDESTTKTFSSPVKDVFSLPVKDNIKHYNKNNKMQRRVLVSKMFLDNRHDISTKLLPPLANDDSKGNNNDNDRKCTPQRVSVSTTVLENDESDLSSNCDDAGDVTICKGGHHYLAAQSEPIYTSCTSYSVTTKTFPSETLQECLPEHVADSLCSSSGGLFDIALHSGMVLTKKNKRKRGRGRRKKKTNNHIIRDNIMYLAEV